MGKGLQNRADAPGRRLLTREVPELLDLVDGADAWQEKHILLLNRWREAGDVDAYAMLHDSLAGLVMHLCVKRAKGNISADELFEYCVHDKRKIRVAIEKYDENDPRSAQISTYLGKIITNAITQYYQSKTGRNKMRTNSVDEKVGASEKSDGVAKLDRMSDGSDMEADAILADTFAKARPLLMAIMYADLTPLQRQAIEKRWLHDGDKERSLCELGRERGVSKEAIRQQEAKARRRIFEVLGGEDRKEKLPITAAVYLMQRFFPEIVCDDQQIAKLASVGVLIKDDGTVDLREATDLRFNTAIFKSNEGSYVSGVDILNSRNMESVFELFTAGDVDERLSAMPCYVEDIPNREKKNVDLTAADIITAVRHPQNMARLQQSFNLHVREDGKWHVCVRTAAFGEKWCFLNRERGLKGGRTVLKFLNRVFDGPDLTFSQPGIKKFFEIILGAENMHFVERKPGGGNYVEYLGRARFLAALRNPTNRSVWEGAGVSFVEDGENKELHAAVNMRNFQHNVKFHIDGHLLAGGAVCDELDIDINQPGFKELCETVFPEHVVYFWNFRNGMDSREEVISEETIIEEMQRPENAKIFRSKAMELADGRLLLAKIGKNGELANLSVRYGKDVGDFADDNFNLFDGSFRLLTIFEKLGWSNTFPSLHELYKGVFGEEKVLTVEEIPKKAQKLVLDEMKQDANVEVVKSLMEKHEDGRLILNLDRFALKGHQVMVFTQEIGILHVLIQRLGWGHGKKAIARLCVELLGEDATVTQAEVDKQKKTPEAALKDLRTPENKATFKALAEELPDGRLLVDLLVTSGVFTGSRWTVFGSKISITTVMARVDKSLGRGDIVWLYRQLFGASKIVTPAELERARTDVLSAAT